MREYSGSMKNGERSLKKVDSTKLSEKKCKDCKRPLKKNSELKGHDRCYVCNKVFTGKLENNAGRNFKKEQLENIRRYKS